VADLTKFSEAELRAYRLAYTEVLAEISTSKIKGLTDQTIPLWAPVLAFCTRQQVATDSLLTVQSDAPPAIQASTPKVGFFKRLYRRVCG